MVKKGTLSIHLLSFLGLVAELGKKEHLAGDNLSKFHVCGWESRDLPWGRPEYSAFGLRPGAVSAGPHMAPGSDETRHIWTYLVCNFTRVISEHDPAEQYQNN